MMDDFECRDNEKMLKKHFIINLLVSWCVHKQTATNLIEPKMLPLLWMEWQEILHEVGHPHLVRAICGWHGSASGTERSHAIHGSTDGTLWPCQTRIPYHPWMVHAIRGWHGSASGTEHTGIPISYPRTSLRSHSEGVPEISFSPARLTKEKEKDRQNTKQRKRKKRTF